PAAGGSESPRRAPPPRSAPDRRGSNLSPEPTAPTRPRRSSSQSRPMRTNRPRTPTLLSRSSRSRQTSPLIRSRTSSPWRRSRGTSPPTRARGCCRSRSQLRHVRAHGREGNSPDLRPAPDPLVQRLHHLAGALPEGPDEHRGPGARDRRPDRAHPRSLLDDLYRPRVEVRTGRLMDPIGEAAADQGQVGALNAKNELRGGGDVGDGVCKRYLVRNRLPRLLGRHLLTGNDHHRLDALRGIQAGRGERALIARADDEAPI